MTTAQALAPMRTMRAAMPDWMPALLCIALVILATRAMWFGDPVADYDEQLYSFIGWRMTQGAVPFVDLWDRKPYGLFALFALAHAIGGPGPLAYQIMGCLFSAVGALFVYAMARNQLDRFGACMAAMLYLLIIAAYGSYAGQSEAFHVPLMTIMAWLVIDTRRGDALRRAMLAMAVGGIALQIKYTVLPQCLFFGVYALWGQWRKGLPLPRLAAAALGFAVLGLAPTVLVAMYYAAIGHWDAFLFANFISFFERAPASVGRFYKDQMAPLAPLALTIFGGIYAAIRFNRPRNIPAYWFYFGWMIAAETSVLLPATVYMYYYGALAPVASLLAIPLFDRQGPFQARYAIVTLLCWMVALNPISRMHETLEHRKTAAALTAAIAPYVGRDGNCLYVFDGPTALYRLTNSCVPTRFVYPDHLNNVLEARALGIDQPGEVARIMATRPGAVVTANNPVAPQNPLSLQAVNEALHAHYVPTANADLYQRRLTVWIRADLAPRR